MNSSRLQTNDEYLKSDRLAAGFIAVGIKTCDRVLICGSNESQVFSDKKQQDFKFFILVNPGLKCIDKNKSERQEEIKRLSKIPKEVNLRITDGWWLRLRLKIYKREAALLV